MRLYDYFSNIFLVTISFISISCGEKAPIEIWQNTSGKEYKILQIGKLKFKDSDERMLYIRFISKNIQNKQELMEEFRDLYIIVAQRRSLQGFTHVGLEAVPRGDPKFGMRRYKSHRDKKSIDEILNLLKNDKNNSNSKI